MLIFNVLWVFMLVLLLIVVTRNEVAFHNRQIIMVAIHDYYWEDFDRFDFNNINNNLYDMMEPYCKTLFRIWDFGYKRILPSEAYELIKDYIRKG